MPYDPSSPLAILLAWLATLDAIQLVVVFYVAVAVIPFVIRLVGGLSLMAFGVLLYAVVCAFEWVSKKLL